ncbi:MAG TPA: hypothetical protein PLY93_01270 [Turneriella sp.]|nr:hypothetical protein [Turneriella sp.]
MRALISFFALIFVLSLSASENIPRVDALVDWKANKIFLRAEWRLNGGYVQAARADIRSRLRAALLAKLSGVVEAIYARGEDNNPSHDLSAYWATVRLDSFQIAENSASATLDVALRGSHSLLSYLPERKWDEAWTSSTEATPSVYDKRALNSAYDTDDEEALLYTGLVIDARELPFTPSLKTQIFTDSGRLLYGAQFLSRATYVKRGAVGFFTAETQSEARRRAGERPLTVPALDLARTSQNSLVISDEDAAKLFAHEGSIQNLRRARVIILLAPNKLQEKY